MRAATIESMGKVEIRHIRADRLVIHPKAQRAIVPSNLRRIKAEMDLDAIGVVYAVNYETEDGGEVRVIDGQHRVKAICDLDLGEWRMAVYIYTEVDDDERACELFLKHNKRSSIHPFDRFETSVIARRGEALTSLSICKSSGLRVTRGKADGCICCPGALMAGAMIDGGVPLKFTIETLKKAWGLLAAAFEGKIVEGMLDVYVRHDCTVDRERLSAQLGKHNGGPGALLGSAKAMANFGGKTIRSRVSEAIVDIYNKGKRGSKLDYV